MTNVANQGGKFYWGFMSEKKYNKLRSEYEGRELDGDAFDGVDHVDYEGAVRIGELCFDVESRYDEDGHKMLSYSLYVGDVDTGYGYVEHDDMGLPEDEREPDYPYDCVDIGYFDSYWIGKDYKEFKKYAEKLFLGAVKQNDKFYRLADLTAKMNEPLNVW